MPRCPTRSRWAQSLFWSWVPWPAARASGRNRLMKLFYGWVIVGAGIVVTCIGVGAGLRAGTASMALLARRVVTSVAWRSDMLVIGDLVWPVVIPAALLVRDPPGPAPAAVGAPAGDQARALTVAQALRTPQFAAIALTYFACCAAHSGPIFHMVTHAIDRGVPAMAAATVFSV